MSQPDFALDPADLDSHAGHVAAHGDAMKTVLDAAATTTPSSDAYGQLCRMVPDALNLVQERVVEALSAAEHALHHTADGLRQIAADLEGTDLDNAAGISAVADTDAAGG